MDTLNRISCALKYGDLEVYRGALIELVRRYQDWMRTQHWTEKNALRLAMKQAEELLSSDGEERKSDRIRKHFDVSEEMRTERIKRSLEALAASGAIELSLEEWKKIAEDVDLEYEQ